MLVWGVFRVVAGAFLVCLRPFSYPCVLRGVNEAGSAWLLEFVGGECLCGASFEAAMNGQWGWSLVSVAT